MNENKKIKRIQVPNFLIKDAEFPHESFYLYVVLKMSCVYNVINIKTSTLMDKLKWSKIGTLKKHLLILQEKELIDFGFEAIPKHVPMEITINSFNESFTQVDVTTINKVCELAEEVTMIRYTKNKTKIEVVVDLKEMALRLFYYYEHQYNEEFDKAFPSFRTTNEDTGIGTAHIKAINDLFDYNGTVEIQNGKWYKKDGQMLKTCNNYKPVCQRKK